MIYATAGCFRRTGQGRGYLAALFLSMLVALIGLGEPSRAAGGFSAVTVDARSGKVLFSVEPDSQRYPASLTKVMTLYIVFQELKAGRLKLNSPLTASHYSAGRPPSRLGLKAGEKITVENAIKALVTRSANDVAATIGENISGSEKAFAVRMTKTARALGMTRSTFRNASGLPDSKQVTTARDMATLSLRIQRDFPQYYPYFRISSFTYKGSVIRTHNRLLGRFAGTDGIKTGYINASGFNLTSSVARSGKRLVGVVMGARTGASRNKYMMTMLEKQFRNASASKTNVIAAMCGTPPGYKGEPLPVVADLTDVPRPAQKPVVVAAQMSIPSMALAGTGTARKSPSPKQEETISEADQSQLATLLPEAGDEADEADSADEDAAEEDGSQDTPSPLAEGLDWPAPTSVAKNDSQPQRPTTIAAVVASAPAEPAPPARPGSSASAAPKKSWQIQIGAYPDKRGAMRQVENALILDLTSLKGKTGFAMSITRGSSTLYRARFSGFSTATSAREACSQLVKKGVSCLMLAPQG